MEQTKITLPETVMEAIRAEAGQLGITPNVFLRIMLCGMYRRADDRTLRIHVDNCTELLAYAKTKKIGGVEHLAVYAMDQYMKRFPLKMAQEGRDGKSTVD